MALNCQSKSVVPVQTYIHIYICTGVKWAGKQIGGNSSSLLTFFPSSWVTVAPPSPPNCAVRSSSYPNFAVEVAAPRRPQDGKAAQNVPTGAPADAAGGYWPICCLPPASIDAELYFYTSLPAKQMSPAMRALGSGVFRHDPFAAPGRGIWFFWVLWSLSICPDPYVNIAWAEIYIQIFPGEAGRHSRHVTNETTTQPSLVI